MGDRANVVIPQDGSEHEEKIYLYTHGSGTELPATLQRALARKQRWDDQPYLTRIIFEEMITGAYSKETGYGISTYPSDGLSRLLIVDTENQQVRIQLGDFDGKPSGEPTCYSFTEYVALNNPRWPGDEDDE